MEDILGFGDLIESRPVEHMGQSDLTFNGMLVPGLKIYEDGGESGCGGKVWIAGELLCEFILEKSRDGELLKDWINDDSVSFGNVLELGSGTGLVGLCVGLVTKEQSQRMVKTYITDIDQLVPLMEKNVELNLIDQQVFAKELLWGEALPIEFAPVKTGQATTSSLDLVLAADCVYLEKAFPLLEKTLLDLTECDNPPVILMAYRKRRKADKHFFQKIRKNFNVIVINDFKNYDQYLKQRTHLFQLVRK
ncbi:Lysine methyltransferase [Nakaseomyces glabratus]|nr:Lysine methyltransferase [Nakaseomyces glabratus]KAH7580207.1 Lysine methyltransferase [Nakaseomyces glabratus]KAI8381920.1 Lysine methyltransferase [Nakaseomyces glabratus]KAI8392148.1 Lysine methyltransferase [Nakaseomyces glabratus]KAJ9573176.1 Protein-lysine N-methyltransferase efm6 [Nakaseomyces glabratus]